MNQQFFALPEEKRLRIIKAGFQVFAQNEYKRASTELIARKAGISKGLLFYYFHNKKSFFMFLFEYAENLVKKHVVDDDFAGITDFFDLNEFAAKKKFELLEKTPHIMEFLLRSAYSHTSDAYDDVNVRIQEQTKSLYDNYYKNIDYSKFRDEVDPQDIQQMLIWTSNGYLQEIQRGNGSLDPSELSKKYTLWTQLLRRACYNEEHL